MSNLPSIRFVSWNTELGVGVTFTSSPFFAKKAFSCATQTGQLKPPGKTIRLTTSSSVCMFPPPGYDNSARRKSHERLERYSKLEPRRDDAARGALQGAEGLRRRPARQPAARVPAQALRGHRLSAADDRQRGNHVPSRRRRLRDAGDRDRRGLQPRLLQGEARQGPADAQPRHQRDLHPDHRQVALRVERGPGDGARRPGRARRDLVPGRRRAPLHERDLRRAGQGDRKSTRVNSSHGYISYAVFCLKKKKPQEATTSNATPKDSPRPPTCTHRSTGVN